METGRYQNGFIRPERTRIADFTTLNNSTGAAGEWLQHLALYQGT